MDDDSIRLIRESVKNLPLDSWMGLDCIQEAYLCDLTLPGTHNSCTWVILDGSKQLFRMSKLLSQWIQCQKLSLLEQLSLGVRYLDFRVLRHPNPPGNRPMSHFPNIWCGHGGWYTVSLYDALLQLKQFLESHPTEVVILSIKHDDLPNYQMPITPPDSPRLSSHRKSNITLNDFSKLNEVLSEDEGLSSKSRLKAQCEIFRDQVDEVVCAIIGHLLPSTVIQYNATKVRQLTCPDVISTSNNNNNMSSSSPSQLVSSPFSSKIEGSHRVQVLYFWANQERYFQPHYGIVTSKPSLPQPLPVEDENFDDDALCLETESYDNNTCLDQPQISSVSSSSLTIPPTEHHQINTPSPTTANKTQADISDPFSAPQRANGLNEIHQSPRLSHDQMKTQDKNLDKTLKVATKFLRSGPSKIRKSFRETRHCFPERLMHYLTKWAQHLPPRSNSCRPWKDILPKRTDHNKRPSLDNSTIVAENLNINVSPSLACRQPRRFRRPPAPPTSCMEFSRAQSPSLPPPRSVSSTLFSPEVIYTGFSLRVLTCEITPMTAESKASNALFVAKHLALSTVKGIANSLLSSSASSNQKKSNDEEDPLAIHKRMRQHHIRQNPSNHSCNAPNSHLPCRRPDSSNSSSSPLISGKPPPPPPPPPKDSVEASRLQPHHAIRPLRTLRTTATTEVSIESSSSPSLKVRVSTPLVTPSIASFSSIGSDSYHEHGLEFEAKELNEIVYLAIERSINQRAKHRPSFFLKDSVTSFSNPTINNAFHPLNSHSSNAQDGTILQTEVCELPYAIPSHENFSKYPSHLPSEFMDDALLSSCSSSSSTATSNEIPKIHESNKANFSNQMNLVNSNQCVKLSDTTSDDNDYSEQRVKKHREWVLNVEKAHVASQDFIEERFCRILIESTIIRLKTMQKMEECYGKVMNSEQVGDMRDSVDFF